MTRCASAACWCSWPPVRIVPSTGERYTLREVEPGMFLYELQGEGYWPTVSDADGVVRALMAREVLG